MGPVPESPPPPPGPPPPAPPPPPPPPPPAWPPPWPGQRAALSPPAPPGWASPNFPVWAWSPPVIGWGRFRAQSFGELLDSAFTVYRRRFLPIVAIMAIFQLPYLALTVLAEQPFAALLPSAGSGISLAPGQSQSLLSSLLVAALVLLAVAVGYQVFLLSLAQGAVVKVVGDDYLDHPSGVGAALKMALGRALPLIAFATLAGVLALAPLVLVILLAVLAGGGAGVLLVILGGLAWAVWVIFVGIRVSLGVQALMLERVGPVAALRRSFRLTVGSFWKIFLFYLVINIVSFIVSGLLQGLAGLLVSALPLSANYLVSAVASGVISIFTSPFILILLTLVYYDVRIRREGFDIEMLAQSLSVER